jgi:hypothetical protein
MAEILLPAKAAGKAANEPCHIFQKKWLEFQKRRNQAGLSV